MVALILSLLGALRSDLRTRADFALENSCPSSAVGQPAAQIEWPPLEHERSRILIGPFQCLVSLGGRAGRRQADTVLRWHRAGFRLFWRWKSRSHDPAVGRVAPKVRRLIRQVAEANVGWGAPRTTESCSNSASTSASDACRASCRPIHGSRLRKRGAPSSTTTSARWHLSISSRCTLRPFAFSMSFPSWPTTAAAFFTSASPKLLLRQQLVVVRRQVKRPRWRRFDRYLVAALAGRFHCLLNAVLLANPRLSFAGTALHGACSGAALRPAPQLALSPRCGGSAACLGANF